MSALAIVLVIRERGGTFALAGLTAGLFTLAGAGSGPIQGRLIGRVGPAPVVFVVATAQSLLFAALAVAARLDAPMPIVVALAIGAGPFLPPISACSRSLWPDLAPGPATLEAAYAVDAISQELLWTCGPALVAVTTAAASAIVAVLLAAVLTLIGGVWFVTAPSVRHRRQPMPTRARGVLTSPGLPTLLVSIALAGLSNGTLALGLPALSTHLGVPSLAGVLLAMLSLGSVIGGLYHGGRSWKLTVQWRYRALLLLAAIFIAPLAAASSLPAAFALSVLAGGAWSSLLSCQFSLVNTVAPMGTTTVAFAWNTSALVVGIAAGTSLAGVIVDDVSVHATFLLAAAASVLASAATLIPTRGLPLAYAPSECEGDS